MRTSNKKSDERDRKTERDKKKERKTERERKEIGLDTDINRALCIYVYTGSMLGSIHTDSCAYLLIFGTLCAPEMSFY